MATQKSLDSSPGKIERVCPIWSLNDSQQTYELMARISCCIKPPHETAGPVCTQIRTITLHVDWFRPVKHVLPAIAGIEFRTPIVVFAHFVDLP